MDDRLFDKPIPWIDGWRLVVVRRSKGEGTGFNVMVSGSRTSRRAAWVKDGVIGFDEGAGASWAGVKLTATERLCLSVLPKDFPATRVEQVLRDPLWQGVIDHCSVLGVMEE